MFREPIDCTPAPTHKGRHWLCRRCDILDAGNLPILIILSGGSHASPHNSSRDNSWCLHFLWTFVEFHRNSAKTQRPIPILFLSHPPNSHEFTTGRIRQAFYQHSHWIADAGSKSYDRNSYEAGALRMLWSLTHTDCLSIVIESTVPSKRFELEYQTAN